MINADVIRKINGGDDKAFRLLYELYFHKVLNYAHRILHSKEDAREVAQDVFIKIWDKRSILDPDQPVSGLVFRITKFLSIDRLRKQSHDIKFMDIATAPDIVVKSIEDEILGKELHYIYQGIINKLPDKRRLIFQLSRDKNLSYHEIAKQLDISPKTVETQIRLALQQIRSEIANYSDTFMIALFLLII